MATRQPRSLGDTLQEFSQRRTLMQQELQKVIIGQHDVIEQLFAAIFTRGHCLLEGVPGLAKTLMVSSLSQILDVQFKRIQFTPDLMPSDITGTNLLDEDEQGRREFRFVEGPIFSNILLADEINRTPPKTQAALLQAMQEREVTVGRSTYQLPVPFFTIATQNPIEQEGTYPLPEAQLDRFMFNVHIDYLPENDEVAVVTQTTSTQPAPLEKLFGHQDVLNFHEVVRCVPVAEDVVRYAVRVAAASRPGQSETPGFVNDWVSWGAGLRAAQFMVLGAKARALLAGNVHATVADIQALAHATLRHRIMVGYRAEAEGITVEQVIDRLLEAVPVPGT